MNLYIMTPKDGAVHGPFNEEEILEHARDGRMSPDWKAAEEGAQDWQPVGNFVQLPRFYDITTPTGPRRLSRKEIEREYLLGTLPPNSLYDDAGNPCYIDTLVSDQAKAERARLLGTAEPAAKKADDDEWEKSPRSRIVYIILGFFLGGLGVHDFYAERPGPGILLLIATLGALMFVQGGVPEIGGIIIIINFFVILIEICSVEFDGNGCKLQ